MPFSGRTRNLTSVRETVFGVTPANPTMTEVRALKEYSLKLALGQIDNNEQHADRMTRKSRNGNKKGDFSIPFQLSYGDFDEYFEETMGGTWTPLASTTGVITIAAAGKTFTRAAGSFITDGFAVGQEIITTNFVTGANNGSFIITAVTALVITCANAAGLVDEVGPAGVNIKTAIDVLKVGNVARSRSFEDRNPTANLYELYNGGVFDSFDLQIVPEKIVTGTFKGLTRDCVIAAVNNASIAVASGGKTFTCAAGGFLKKGSPFAVGMNIITSGFTNAGNNGIFVITAVTDTVITCGGAAGLVTEGVAAGRSIVMGSVDDDYTAASEIEPYDSYLGDLAEGSADQTEVTGVSISFANGMQTNYVILTPGADAAASIKPGNELIKITGDLSIFFENQGFKQRYLAGEASDLNILLGSGIPGEKSMKLVMGAIQYTGNERTNDATIIEKAPFKANYHSASATALEIHRIP